MVTAKRTEEVAQKCRGSASQPVASETSCWSQPTAGITLRTTLTSSCFIGAWLGQVLRSAPDASGSMVIPTKCGCTWSRSVHRTLSSSFPPSPRPLQIVEVDSETSQLSKSFLI
uniref:(northern house mosquito) hypothetical protein n=1 Tax=Culex pipiens TaxID=7175 RepID=A0A8D8L9D5_CULPI